VEGHESDFDRKTAIFTSDKKECLVLDFAGVSEHKLVDVWDVLGGNYDAETVELAEREGDKKNISEDLEKAKAIRQLMLQWQERENIIADAAEYRSYEVNPFGGPSPAMPNGKKRGGASDAQIGLLVGLGVSLETAEGYSKRQAGAVISSLKEKRCTEKQAKVLGKYGIPVAGINMDCASDIIDAIVNNKWKPIGPQQIDRIIAEYAQ
jgi:hypothetical protein